MRSHEMILESLIAEEIQALGPKFDFWKQSFPIPKGENWTNEKSLTLEKFLSEHPEPSEKDQIPLYGMAWELIWGTPPPESVKEARENLLLRTRLGMQISEMEELWLKLISIDPELF